ncbi:MAG: O-antigen ligase family protein [Gemmatimonadales bacterium]|nr:O-antigen ligase family protein [Gemmatimonadales bacterium]
MPVQTETDRVDAFQVVVWVALLLYAWRLQDLVSVLGSLNIFPVVSAAVLVLFLLDRDPRRGQRRWRDRTVTLALLLAAWGLASLATSIYPSRGLRFLVLDHGRTLVVMLIVMASIRSIGDVRKLMWVHIAGAATTALLGLLMFRSSSSGRMMIAYYYDPNDVAMLLACAAPVVFTVFRRGMPLWARIAGVVTVLLMAATIVGTESRGGFLALVAVGIFALVRQRSIRPSVRWFGTALLVACISFAATGGFWERMQTMLHPTEDYNWVGQARTGRLEVWRRGVGYMIGNPVFGTGLNTFAIAEGTMPEAVALQEQGIGIKWSAPHNSFVQIGAELGVPALLIYLALIGYTMRSMWRLSRSGGGRSADGGAAAGSDIAEAVLGALCAYCVGGFFLTQAYSKFLYLGLFPIAVGLSTLRGGSVHDAIVRLPAHVRRRQARVTFADNPPR